MADDAKSEENRSGEKILFAARVAFALSVSPFFLLSFGPVVFLMERFSGPNLEPGIVEKPRVSQREPVCTAFQAPASCKEV